MSSTADWNPLGNIFYRKFELYALQWMNKENLSNYIVCAAPYGGPIAVLPNETKLLKTGLAANKPTIRIFTSAGVQIAAFKWNSGNLLQLGWSNVEDLICVQEDGSVLIYDLFGTFKKTFTMGQEAKDVKVIQCKIFTSFSGTTGIAVLTSAYRIFLVNNIEEPRIRRLPEIQGIDAPPGCWAIISSGTQSRALVAKDADLYMLDYTGQCEKQVLLMSQPANSFIEMALSVNNKYLALFTSNGILWIGSSDLQNTYCEFDTKCYSRPHQFAWCGGGAVVCFWDGILLMVGPSKDWIKFSYDSAVTLVPEIDGLRIISTTSHELLHRVPAVLEDINKIGSLAPGAVLFEAYNLFQVGSQRTDEYIRIIKNQLDMAVRQCIDAAGEEFDPAKQKALLRAALFGKCFIVDYKTNEFVGLCELLRVLNAIRAPSVALPLTFTQFEHLKVSIVIDRLILRRKYWLALAICQYLKIPESDGASRILAHWACYKVQQSGVNEDMLAQTITEKLNDTPGVSYSEIANHALECGKVNLAIRLLNSEPKASEQVPLLMKMRKDQLALTKALESGDTDLVYMVLMHLKDKMQLGEFLMAIRVTPGAYSLYLQYCREQNPKMLRDLYYQEDNHCEEANCRVADSYDEESNEARINILTSAQEAFGKARNEVAAKVTEEQVKLMRYQNRLEEEFNKPFLDLSLHQTVHQLVLSNNNKLVEQMRKEFRIPDRRFWWLKILALAEMGDWAELDRFSKSKKSPIGYEPFVEVCVKYGNRTEAEKYLAKVAPENMVKCLIKMGQLEQAANLALQNKSVDELNLVMSKCATTNRTLTERIIGMKQQLGAKH